MTLSPDDKRHGTVNGYSNLACRCQRCRDAWALETTEARKRRNARIAEAEVEHGSHSTYINWLCRCAACKQAHRERRRLDRSK
jgi:hypothetical protein